MVLDLKGTDVHWLKTLFKPLAIGVEWDTIGYIYFINYGGLDKWRIRHDYHIVYNPTRKCFPYNMDNDPMVNYITSVVENARK